jgi:hypothetical protein
MLNQHLINIEQGVEDSITSGGYQIGWTLDHTLIIDPISKKIKQDQYFVLGNDVFPEMDSIFLDGSNYKRMYLSFNVFPEYNYYQLTTHELGKDILTEFEVMANQYNEYTKVSLNTLTYNRNLAAAYIRSFTSNPSTTCVSNTTVKQDKTKYNSNYSWLYNMSEMECKDCADYVSQALHAGGHLFLGNWTPGYYSEWVNVDSLVSFITTNNRGFTSTNINILALGDLAYTPGVHIAMVGQLAPPRYSGHTNDRLDFAVTGKFSNFVKIFDNPPQ